MTALLEVEELERRLRRRARRPRPRPPRRRGRGRRAARPQRRRQDDDAADHLGARAHPGRRHQGPRPIGQGPAAPPRRPRRPGPRARGPLAVPRPHRQGEPPPRRGRRARPTSTRRSTTSRPSSRILDRRAGLLSGGEQQMLAMGRALTVRPRLLMVDEMSLGLAPIIVERLLPVLRTIADQTGAGVLARRAARPPGPGGRRPGLRPVPRRTWPWRARRPSSRRTATCWSPATWASPRSPAAEEEQEEIEQGLEAPAPSGGAGDTSTAAALDRAARLTRRHGGHGGGATS